jgi:hypothetical protein
VAEGVRHVRDSLGIDPPDGGAHPEMGTHNRVLRLGDDVYLEVIAVDPDAPRPAGPRWFGFDRPDDVSADWDRGLRLRAWVGRTSDIGAVLAGNEALFGSKTRIGRQSWFSLLPDGGLPASGMLPSLIDRGGLPSRAALLPDLGARLREFVLEHPRPAAVSEQFQRFGIAGPPTVLEGPTFRFAALIETPRGERRLT